MEPLAADWPFRTDPMFTNLLVKLIQLFTSGSSSHRPDYQSLGKAGFKAWLKNPAVLTVVSSTLLLASVLILAFHFSADWRSGPKINEDGQKQFDQLGDLMAVMSSKYLMGGENAVVLIEPSVSAGGMGTDRYKAAFLEKIRQMDCERRIKAWEVFPPAGAQMSFITEKALDELIKKYPDAQVIISFVGVPEFPKERVIPDNFPSIIAYTAFFEDLPELVSDGVVEIAIIPKLQVSSGMSSGGLGGQAFDVIDSTNAEEYQRVVDSLDSRTLAQ